MYRFWAQKPLGYHFGCSLLLQDTEGYAEFLKPKELNFHLGYTIKINSDTTQNPIHCSKSPEILGAGLIQSTICRL